MVTPGRHRWPRGAWGRIFDDFVLILGVTFGTLGAHVAVLLRSVLFTRFTQAPGAAFSRFVVDFGCHFEAFFEVFGPGWKV